MADELQKRRGLWLENFLNPAAKVDDYHTGSGKALGFRSLARESLDILNIKEDFDLDNDPGLKALDLILKAKKEVQKFYDLDNIEFYSKKKKAVDGFREIEWLKAVKKGSDLLRLDMKTDIVGVVDSEKLVRRIGQDPEPFPELAVLKDCIYGPLCAQFTLTQWFREIFNAHPTPWEKTLYKQYYEDSGDWDITPAHYGIVERLFVNHAQETISFERGINYARYPACFPWKHVGVIIALDFLRHGGQDRFIFCSYCNRFAYVQRIGKRYCSDLCRTNARHKCMKA